MPAGSNCARMMAGPTRRVGALVYLSQNYDSIGATAERQIQDGQVEVENAADAGDFYRTNSNYTPSDLQTLPRDLPAYIRAVQQIVATARAERLARADRAFQAMLTPQLVDRTAEFERINRLANGIVLALHADDLPTLQRTTRIILSRPENIRESVRGEFAVAIASNYFRPGFDAIREVAFENSDTWSSEGAALTNLSRVGNTRDLERMRREAEAIIAAGQYRQVRYSLFWAMGELAARCYAEGSSKRAEWRKWFEKCAHVPLRKRESWVVPASPPVLCITSVTKRTRRCSSRSKLTIPRCAAHFPGPSGTSMRG